MFNFLKKSPPVQPPSESIYLYMVPLKVKHLEGGSLPENLKGAFVMCYVPSTDHLKATSEAFQKLSEMKYDVVDMAGDVQQLDPRLWGEYVTKNWPELPTHFPTQEQLLSHLKSRTMFFGPFIGWDEEEME